MTKFWIDGYKGLSPREYLRYKRARVVLAELAILIAAAALLFFML